MSSINTTKQKDRCLNMKYYDDLASTCRQKKKKFDGASHQIEQQYIKTEIKNT